MSVLFVVIDSLRADVLGCCGGAARTPTVDSLAQSAALFPKTVSAAPWTVPSVAAMLTGVYPHRLGLAQWEQPWPAKHPSLFDLAERAGLEVASFVFEPRYFFRGVPAARVAGSSQNTGGVIDWLRERKAGRFFAFVHYWWTHVPYIDRPATVPEWRRLTDVVLDAVRAGGTAREGVKGLYRRAVELFSEEWLPRVLDAVDLERTWVVLLADHGESWGERAGASGVRDVFDLHGNDLFEETLRVPWLVRPPGGCAPRTVGGLARTVDVFPTLAELLGLGDVPTDIDGRSLADSVRDGRPAPSLDAVSVRNRDVLNRPHLPDDPRDLWCGWALTTPRDKLVWEPAATSRQRYDLIADPLETNNLVHGDDPAAGELWKRLEAEASRAVVGRAGGEDLARTAERLRELGYLE